MKLLRPGGVLATSTCSHHVGRELFLEILRTAAKDAAREFRIIYEGRQSPDHPILLGMPETAYLKCFILELIG
jgi:23S rRNA (cytosine1962-C5)-methyltransferase